MPSVALAQATVPAPSTVTPPTLTPPGTGNDADITVPKVEGLTPPPGSAALAFTPGKIDVEGVLPGLAPAVAGLSGAIEGRATTLAEIYRIASAIEAAHVRAGYILARVSLPPQRLVSGGPVRMVVTDGFIDAIDAHTLPPAVRRPVELRLASLQGARHLTQARLERQLLLAGDVAGVTLRSTLARGEQAGGVRLIVEGRRQAIRGSVGGDNSVDRTLAEANISAQLALNSVLGAGETIYAYAATSDAARPFAADTRIRVLGAGVLFPLGDGRLVLNPEVTISKTQPVVQPGVPRTRGDLERYALRMSYTLDRTRQRETSLSLAFDAIDQRNVAVDFDTDLARDRYVTARLGVTRTQFGPATRLSFGAQLAKGLSGRASDVGTPATRQGAHPGFTKFSAQLRANRTLLPRVELAVIALGQTSFGAPLYRAEQFQLEGGDAVSAFVGGVTAVDEGGTVRGELSSPLRLRTLTIVPYAFGAGGAGHVANPTTVEQATLRVAAVGVGLRASLLRPGITIGVEFAQGFADLAAIDHRNRVNATATLRF